MLPLLWLTASIGVSALNNAGNQGPLESLSLPALDHEKLNSMLDVFVITLPKRLFHARGELKKTHLFRYAELLNATTPDEIDPWERSPVTALNKGESACSVSHSRSYRYFLDNSKKEFALIFEDDFLATKTLKDPSNMPRVISALLEDQKKTGWDILNLGRCNDCCTEKCQTTKSVVAGKFKIVKSFSGYCGTAYLVNRKGARALRVGSYPVDVISDDNLVNTGRSGRANYMTMTPKLFQQDRVTFGSEIHDIPPEDECVPNWDCNNRCESGIEENPNNKTTGFIQETQNPVHLPMILHPDTELKDEQRLNFLAHLDYLTSKDCKLDKSMSLRVVEWGFGATINSIIKPVFHAMKYGYCLKNPSGYVKYHCNKGGVWNELLRPTTSDSLKKQHSVISREVEAASPKKKYPVTLFQMFSEISKQNPHVLSEIKREGICNDDVNALNDLAEAAGFGRGYVCQDAKNHDFCGNPEVKTICCQTCTAPAPTALPTPYKMKPSTYPTTYSVALEQDSAKAEPVPEGTCGDNVNALNDLAEAAGFGRGYVCQDAKNHDFCGNPEVKTICCQTCTAPAPTALPTPYKMKPSTYPTAYSAKFTSKEGECKDDVYALNDLAYAAGFGRGYVCQDAKTHDYCGNEEVKTICCQTCTAPAPPAPTALPTPYKMKPSTYPTTYSVALEQDSAKAEPVPEGTCGDNVNALNDLAEAAGFGRGYVCQDAKNHNYCDNPEVKTICCRTCAPAPTGIPTTFAMKPIQPSSFPSTYSAMAVKTASFPSAMSLSAEQNAKVVPFGFEASLERVEATQRKKENMVKAEEYYRGLTDNTVCGKAFNNQSLDNWEDEDFNKCSQMYSFNKHGDAMLPPQAKGMGFFATVSLVASYLSRPSDSLAAKLHETKKAVNWPAKGTPVIALHYRAGDSCLEYVDALGRKCDTFATYMQHVDRMAKEYDIKHIYLATDSDSVIKDEVPKYPQYTFHYIKDMDRGGIRNKTPIDDLLKFGKLDGCKEAENSMLDMYMLSMADAYIGKFSSNIDRVAYNLMFARTGAHQPYISLDNNWCFDFAVRSRLDTLTDREDFVYC